jgi:hypothetical protein
MARRDRSCRSKNSRHNRHIASRSIVANADGQVAGRAAKISLTSGGTEWWPPPGGDIADDSVTCEMSVSALGEVAQSQTIGTEQIRRMPCGDVRRHRGSGDKAMSVWRPSRARHVGASARFAR